MVAMAVREILLSGEDDSNVVTISPRRPTDWEDEVIIQSPMLKQERVRIAVRLSGGALMIKPSGFLDPGDWMIVLGIVNNYRGKIIAAIR